MKREFRINQIKSDVKEQFEAVQSGTVYIYESENIEEFTGVIENEEYWDDNWND